MRCGFANVAAVTGGTVAIAGRLLVRADKVGADTQLAHLVRLVEQAQGQKAAIARLADRISSFFVPSVLVLSAATLVGWLAAGDHRNLANRAQQKVERDQALSCGGRLTLEKRLNRFERASASTSSPSGSLATCTW